MTIKELRTLAGMTQKEFCEYFNVPKRTLEDWEADVRKCKPYLIELIEYKLRKEKKIK
jgi:DNA-binding transcriptional regulator YiaG